MTTTFGGEMMTLVGKQVAVGDVLPDGRVVTLDLQVKKLAEYYNNKVTVLSFAPSLDTRVCDLQTRGFISRLANTKGVSLITVSEDLPFAQKRWCGAADAEQATVFSDYRFHDVGQNFGALMVELQLLARVVIVADSQKIIRYVEYVPEVKNQVNFEAAEAVVQQLLAE